jgi:hypothetical protein
MVPYWKSTTASYYVVTITGINGTVVINATTGSYYVVTITSIDGGKVGETTANKVPPLAMIVSFPLPVFISPLF